MDTSTADIMDRGMQCLLERLGVVEAERFISVIIREQFDYTKWQKQYFDNMSPRQINTEAKEYMDKHPFKGKADIIL